MITKSLLTSYVLMCVWISIPPLRGQTNKFPSTGNVGIGTPNPVYPLDVSNTAIVALRINGTEGITGSNNTQLRFAGGKNGELWALGTDEAANNGSRDLHFYALPNAGGVVAMTLQSGSGNVGIGATAPGANLHVVDLANSGGPLLRLAAGTGGGQYFDFVRNNGTGALSIQGNQTGNNNILLAPTSGNVGIGTVKPCANTQGFTSTCKLSVTGGIQAYEVVVNNTWSDYVFDPDYQLAPLKEVGDYIKAHHHLPEIPSASDVAEKGISLGDMQAKLLAKIEELTLHMIRAEVRSDRLEQENCELRKEIRDLTEKVER